MELYAQYSVAISNGPTNCCTGTYNAKTTTVGDSTQRAISSLTGAWGGQSSSFYQPPELFTSMEVSLGDLSMELDMLGEVCLENA